CSGRLFAKTAIADWRRTAANRGQNGEEGSRGARRGRRGKRGQSSVLSRLAVFPCAPRSPPGGEIFGADAPFLGGDLRWPNGPWPGEKTPYFSAKTGHMARHGIWPSDRICLRWAGWVKPRHGLVIPWSWHDLLTVPCRADRRRWRAGTVGDRATTSSALAWLGRAAVPTRWLGSEGRAFFAPADEVSCLSSSFRASPAALVFGYCCTISS